MYLEDIYTLSPNLAGLPAMSIPCGMSQDQLPIGLQIIGNYFSEPKMLQIADHYQRNTNWHQLQPLTNSLVGAAS
jgi:aspartyl-tRNA(Asn)/glutamyl-tRNA(Gln) amidotransferase subunit A